MSVEYPYVKAVDIPRLTAEITASTIVTALDYINVAGTNVSIFFKATLSGDDNTTLDTLVANHVNTPLDTALDPITVEAYSVKNDDGVPLVHATPKPKNMASYFSSCGDNGANVGEGNCLMFNMTPSDVSKQVDVTFNEDVYIKDGLVMSRNAPFGALVDVLVVHPIYNTVLFAFCKNICILGDYPVELDTDDRALITAGLVVRIVVHNSTGLNGTDAPANFQVAGRIELFRNYPDIGL